MRDQNEESKVKEHEQGAKEQGAYRSGCQVVEAVLKPNAQVCRMGAVNGTEVIERHGPPCVVLGGRCLRTPLASHTATRSRIQRKAHADTPTNTRARVASSSSRSSSADVGMRETRSRRHRSLPIQEGIDTLNNVCQNEAVGGGASARSNC